MEEENNNKQKKNRLKDIKEFLSDKKNKAIVKLIIYLIFFIFVIIYIRVMNYKANNYTKKIDPDEIIELPKTITNKVSLLKDAKNYKFRYEINVINDNVNTNYIIDGKRYNDKYYFSITDNEISTNYYYESNSNKLYLIKDEIKEEINSNNIIDLSLYKINNIYDYLYNATYNYKQENANGDILINSNLPMSKFNEINNISSDMNGNIIMETTENINLIKVALDITDLFKYNNQNIEKIFLTIYINDLNNVEYFNY